jgi:hypothetical protein
MKAALERCADSTLLANLERKLDIDLASARAALAHLRAQESAGRDALQQARAEYAAHEHRATAALAGVRLDPRSHAQALKHLVHLRGELARREQDAQALRQRVTAATRACANQDRQLASVRELRASARRLQAALAQRRALAESDRAWLARSVSCSATGDSA